jgi:hypothetical protein
LKKAGNCGFFASWLSSDSGAISRAAGAMDMKLTFKENFREKEPTPDDIRRTHGGEEAPVTLRTPGKKVRVPIQAASSTLGFVLMIVIGAVCLFDFKEHLWLLDEYLYRVVRLCVIAAVCLLILMDAFGQTAMYGFLCFFPPFLLFYGFTMAESSLLRGMLTGLMVWLGVELLIIPKQSFFEASRVAINNTIEGGHDWLQNANR